MTCSEVDLVWKESVTGCPSWSWELKVSGRTVSLGTEIHKDLRRACVTNGLPSVQNHAIENPTIKLHQENPRIKLHQENPRITLHQEFEDHTALLSSMKECGIQKDLRKASSIHTDLLERGLLQKNIYLGNALLSMYIKCGLLSKAEEVFNDLPTRNVVTWNALISGYVQRRLIHEALSSLVRMEHEGVFPNAVTFTCLMKACASIGAIEKGQKVHAEVSRLGLLETDIEVGNALVDMYAKCSMLAKAQEVFDELSAHDVVSWNALIGGYAHHGMGDVALSCFEQMKDEGFSPNEVTFISALKACGSVKAFQKVEEIHVEVGRQGLLEKDIVLGTALVDMYAKCGALAKAHGVFKDLPARDVVMWNALITGYVQHGFNDEALSCFEEMRDADFFPNSVTFIGVLKACGSTKAVKKGEELHAEVQRQGLLQKDMTLGTAVVDMYVKCGELAKAQEVFDGLSTRDVVTWNVILAGYAQHGFAAEALHCYEQMQNEGLSPDAVTFIGTLKACGSLGTTEKCKEKLEKIHAEVVRWGILQKELELGNALVSAYAECGMLAKAQQIFNELPARNEVTWNALIAGYTQQGFNHEALDCFAQMQEEGFSPDVVTFICLIKAYGNIGVAEKGLEIHAEVRRQGLLQKNSMLGTALVDMYAKCGMLAKAEEVFEALHDRDVVTWTALITGYLEHRMVDEAMSYFEKMRDGGLSPDAVTLVCFLKACGSIGAAKKGKEMHMEIDKQGLFGRDIELGTALVDMYAKCGLVVEAQEVSDKLSARTIVTWNSLIAGYTQLGKAKRVGELFNQMIGEGTNPNEVTFLALLTGCSHAGLVEEGQMCFDSMSTLYSVNPSTEHSICMVDLLSRTGQFDEAIGMIEKVPPHGRLLLWSSLLGACQNSGIEELGSFAFENAVKSDEKFAAAYVCMSNIYGVVGICKEANYG